MITFNLIKGKWYRAVNDCSGYMRFNGVVRGDYRRGYDVRIWSYDCELEVSSGNTNWVSGYVEVSLTELIKIFPHHKKRLIELSRIQNINNVFPEKSDTINK